jgi:hypothetical protein
VPWREESRGKRGRGGGEIRNQKLEIRKQKVEIRREGGGQERKGEEKMAT